jgi:hypothetical protein
MRERSKQRGPGAGRLRPLTTLHGQDSTRPVVSAPDARFRVAPHLYSTVSVFTTPGAGSPHQPLLTDTRQRGRKPPHASLARFLISGPAVHVRPGTPYSASTISMDPVDARCRTVQSSSMPPTNARATMTNVRRFGLIPAHFLLADVPSVEEHIVHHASSLEEPRGPFPTKTPQCDVAAGASRGCATLCASQLRVRKDTRDGSRD